MTEEYYTSLYEKVPGRYVAVSAQNPKTKKFYKNKFVPVEDVWSTLNSTEFGQPDNLFVTYNVFGEKPLDGRGKAGDVEWIVGSYFDLDIGIDGPYATVKNPALALNQVKEQLRIWGFPDPTAIVTSGGGLHFEYRLAQPYQITDKDDRTRVASILKGYTGHLIDCAAAIGWTIDNVSDLPRVKRAVGSTNYKDAPHLRKVEVLEFNPERLFSLEHFAAFSPKVVVATTPSLKPFEKASLGKLPNFQSILAGDPFSRHCVKNAATLKEPDWYAFLSIVSRCEDGDALAHEHSKPYPGYTFAETAEKIKHARNDTGPTTYAYIRDGLGFKGLDGFWLSTRLTSPIQLGYEKPQLVPLLEDHAYVISTDQFVNVHTLATRSEKAFRNEHLHVGLSNPPVDLNRSRLALKVERQSYRPGEPRITKDEDGRQILNVYREPTLAKAKGDCSTMMAHFDEVFPNQDERRHVLDYLSYTVQNPGVKMMSALVMYGPEGGGKGTIMHWMRDIIGPSNYLGLPASAIDNRFKSDRGNKQLLTFNEASGIGKPQMEELKEWVTEPTQEVEGKNIPRHTVETPRAIVFMSNHENALHITPGDRRYAVSQTRAIPPDEAYFKKLYAKVPEEISAFAYELSVRPLGHFNPHGRPQVTASKLAMMRASLSPLEVAISDAMEAQIGCFEREFGTAEDVIRTVLDEGWLGRRPAPQTVGNILAEMGAEKMPRIAIRARGKPNHHAWRKQEGWLRAERSEIEEHLGIGPEIAANDASVTSISSLVEEAERVA